MAIDQLTDEAFFEAYQQNPKIKKLVDGIQRKYHAHYDQRNKPDYKEANIPIAMKEAKETVEQLLEQKEHEVASASAPSLTTQYVTGLLGILTTIAAFAAGVYSIGLIAAAVTGATLFSQYQSQNYKQKPA